MNISTALRVALTERNLTQSELANRTKRSLRWVNRVAVGEVDPLDDVRLLSEALNLPVSDFIAMAERYPDPTRTEKQAVA